MSEDISPKPKRLPQSYACVSDYLESEGWEVSTLADAYFCLVDGEQRTITAAQVATHSTPLEMARWLQRKNWGRR